MLNSNQLLENLVALYKKANNSETSVDVILNTVLTKQGCKLFNSNNNRSTKVNIIEQLMKDVLKIEIEKGEEDDVEINEIVNAATCSTVQDASIKMTEDTLRSIGREPNTYKKKIELLSKFLITLQHPPKKYTCVNTWPKEKQIPTSTEALLIDPFIKHFEFFVKDDPTEMSHQIPVSALIMDFVLRNKDKNLTFGT